ncbi:xylulokinase [Pseudotabrizicola alkalilacus]|uniref:Xylulose kinase n=1 Tax=Pseudotabrizicola alkalilacus TaxID=2305252 RepID=A0A411YWR5_9RHOB|nr:xylulokinase [Pseudotabrizicola alkalilacus]RGP35175.1 xylulokinase [Pseudotabrizicola alkalilacus]
MFLGIDLGTSGVKSVIIDAGQTLVAEASSSPLEIRRAQPGWSEQHPDLWWNAVCESLDALTASHPAAMAEVAGIGLSGQMYGATVLDAADRPLRPAILWNDTRSSAECAELAAAVPDLLDHVGRAPTPGVTASKLMWLRRHEPNTFDAVRMVLLPKDYIRLRLSGDKASDLADSSGTMWVDLAARDWSGTMLAASGMDRSQMPRLCEGTEATGTLRAALAQRWGMRHRPVIAGGGGDNACGACGTGVIEDGEGTVSLGTSGVLFVANDRPRPAGAFAIETLCHAVPDRWHQMSVVLSATSCLSWLGARLKRSPAELVALLGEDPRPATDLIFVPFLDGCWSPRSDGSMRGGFMGLAHQHDDAAMAQAVMQGVSFAIRDCAEAFRVGGGELRRLLAIGGGSRSKLWVSMLATSLGVELDVPRSSALGAAFGAARLGMIAATGAPPRDVLTRPDIALTVGPQTAHADSYDHAFQRWQAFARLC